MDTAVLPASPAPPDGPDEEAALDLVVRALTHLLDRGEQPARWRTPAFAEAVEAARAPLAGAGDRELRDAIRERGMRVPDFVGAVEHLGRDAVLTAVAIVAFERRQQRRLAPWPGLASARVGPPGTTARADDVALWFG